MCTFLSSYQVKTWYTPLTICLSIVADIFFSDFLDLNRAHGNHLYLSISCSVCLQSFWLLVCFLVDLSDVLGAQRLYATIRILIVCFRFEDNIHKYVLIIHRQTRTFVCWLNTDVLDTIYETFLTCLHWSYLVQVVFIRITWVSIVWLATTPQIRIHNADLKSEIAFLDISTLILLQITCK